MCGVRDALQLAGPPAPRAEMVPRDGRPVLHKAAVLAVLAAALPVGVVCPHAGGVASTANAFTGFWKVVLEDSSMLAMIYSDPTTSSSPLRLVPSGSVLRGVEDW